MATFKTIVTDVGQRKITEATLNGGKVNIVKAAVGDGGGNFYTPTTGQTELKRETWRGDIAFKQINENDRKVIDVKVIIPADVGGFTVREAGLFDDEGDMIVVCNTPSTEKATIAIGSASTLTLFMHIIFSDMNAVNIRVEPTIDVMTHDEVAAMIEVEARARELGDSAAVEALRQVRLHRESADAEFQAEAKAREAGDTKTLTDAKSYTDTKAADALKQAKQYADELHAAIKVWDYKGTLGASGTVKELPKSGYKTGWNYCVATAGTYAGAKLEVGDIVICVKDFDGTAKDSDWSFVQGNIDGAVVGPASAVDKRIAVFDGTTGKLISDGGTTIAELTAEQEKKLDIVRRSASTNVSFLDTDNFDVVFDGPAKTVTITKKSTATTDDLAYTLTETDDEMFLNDLNITTVINAMDETCDEFFSHTGSGTADSPLVLTAIKPFAFGFTVANNEQYHGNAIALTVGAVDEASKYLDGVGAVQTAFFCGPKDGGEYVWAGPWVEQAKVVKKAERLNTARNINDTEFDGTKNIRLKNTWNYVVNASSSTVTQRYISFSRTGSGKATVLMTSNDCVYLILLTGTTGYKVVEIANNGTSAGSFRTYNDGLILFQTGRPCPAVYFTVLGNTYTTLSFTPHNGAPTPMENAEVQSLAELPIGTEDIGDGAITAAKLAAAVSSQLHTHSNKTVLDGIGINQVTNWNGAYDHSQKKDNPHGVSKAQVGLGNVDNTSDMNKPVSKAQQAAIDFAQTPGLEALRGIKAHDEMFRAKRIFRGISTPAETQTVDLSNESFTAATYNILLFIQTNTEQKTSKVIIKLPQLPEWISEINVMAMGGVSETVSLDIDRADKGLAFTGEMNMTSVDIGLGLVPAGTASVKSFRLEGDSADLLIQM